MDILVLGELNADLIVRGDVTPAWNQIEQLVDDATLTLGSSSAIFAAGAARLGLRVGFAGLVGDDLLGNFCRAALQAKGVDTSGVVVDPGQRTGITVILQRDDDRSMLTFPGAMAAFGAQHLAPELLNAARHVHIGSFFLQTALQGSIAALFSAIRVRGATTSLDTGWDPSQRWEGLDAVLAATDMFLPNQAEACAVTGSDDWKTALGALARRVPAVALKRGSAGAAAGAGATVVERAAPRVAMVDAVGAGDSFDAGFVYGMLAGWPLERCLSLAVACGSLSTRAAGGTAAQPTLAEALALV